MINEHKAAGIGKAILVYLRQFILHWLDHVERPEAVEAGVEFILHPVDGQEVFPHVGLAWNAWIAAGSTPGRTHKPASRHRTVNRSPRLGTLPPIGPVRQQPFCIVSKAHHRASLGCRFAQAPHAHQDDDN